MKKFFSEFKEFVMRGNVLDLAVGVIIGAAFQAIVTSLTSDIISPILGIFGGMNFDQLSFIQATVHCRLRSTDSPFTEKELSSTAATEA